MKPTSWLHFNIRILFKKYQAIGQEKYNYSPGSLNLQLHWKYFLVKSLGLPILGISRISIWKWSTVSWQVLYVFTVSHFQLIFSLENSRHKMSNMGALHTTEVVRLDKKCFSFSFMVLLLMHHSMGIKENNQHHFALLHNCYAFWLQGSWLSSLWWCSFGFWDTHH